jgi:hypothetical protein
LRSICIPSSVEILCQWCFCTSSWLLSVTFQWGSRLNRIERRVFWECSQLRSIYIPPSVKSLPCGCFEGCAVKSYRIVKLELQGIIRWASSNPYNFSAVWHRASIDLSNLVNLNFESKRIRKVSRTIVKRIEFRRRLSLAILVF